MNKALNILNWLNNPQSLSNSDLEELNRMLLDAPWFQPFYFLLLHNYQNDNKARFNLVLQKASMHVSNKGLLMRYLKNDWPLKNNEPVDNKNELQPESIQDAPATNGTQNINDQIATETEPGIGNGPLRRNDADSLGEALIDAVSRHITSYTEVLEKSIIPEITFELDESADIVKPENPDYMPFSMAIDEMPENKSEILIIEENIPEQTNTVDNINIEPQSPDPDNQLPVEEKITPLTASDFDAEENSTGIVIDMHEEPTDDSTIFQNNQQSEKDNAPESLPFTAWFEHLQPNAASLSQPLQPNQENTNKTGTFDLIDKFLQEEPRIKPKPITGEQEDISQASVEEHDDFMTDTLAKIYFKQGNYEKAISVYKKLSLRFPEKSSYFASQINEINKIINTQ